MAKLFASTNCKISEREKRNMERARSIAVQGMVLLENNGALPLKCDIPIALYGNGARHTVKGGTGSGDVNSRYVVNIEQGLENAGFKITTKNWLNRYDKVMEVARNSYTQSLKEKAADENFNIIKELFESPFKTPPISKVTKEDIKASETNTAVYILSRNSGEGKDRRLEGGEYELYEEEKEAIGKITEGYERVIIVLNVGGVIDTSYLKKLSGRNAVLLMSQAGNIGGYALADVLTGKVNPSGHLASTWAEKYMDYPGASTYSSINGNLDDEYYEEGIYVGYRYFDTFNVTPAYPFGYGLSYTTFEIKTKNVEVKNGTVEIKVCVTNTGNQYAGKEVVQVYYSAPQGEIEKPYQELAAYVKTKELQPKEQQFLTLSYSLEDMAVYEEKSASYLLEKGIYYVRVGNHSRNTHIAAALVLKESRVIQKLKNLLSPDCELKQLSSGNILPYTYEGEEEEKIAASKIVVDIASISYQEVIYKNQEKKVYREEKETVLSEKKADKGEGKKRKPDNIRENPATLEAMVNQLTIEEMAQLCVGTAREGEKEKSVIGAASFLCPGAAGDTTSCLIETHNIQNMILSDGPAGLRLSKTFMADKEGNPIPGTEDAAFPGMEWMMEKNKKRLPKDAITYYQYCTAIPIATLLAQTWDVNLVEEAGDIVGEEMEEFGVHLWLAPGMNIHRNPLCGRNFEYYSEDPLVSGMCAAAETIGVQKHRGKGATIKHFAFNNQEDNRKYTNAHIGERAIREIYLKGFELAIKKSKPLSIMTSYNLINGIHTANSYELLTAIAREEWGFDGMIMTDWGTTHKESPEATRNCKYGGSNAAGCIKAGNDLIMPGSQKDIDEIIHSVDADEKSVEYPLTKEELRICAKRILKTIIKSSAYEEWEKIECAEDE